jgi:ankyrin repeat protein
VEPIFEAVLANDPSRIAAIEAATPGAAAQRTEEDLFVAELPHMLYRGDTPLHLAAAGLRYDAARALLAAGIPVSTVNRRGATALHYGGANPRAVTRKAGSTPLHLAVAPTGASGTAGAGELQLEIVRMLLAAGATLADTDRNGVTVADRIQSQALRDALAAGHL